MAYHSGPVRDLILRRKKKKKKGKLREVEAANRKIEVVLNYLTNLKLAWAI